MAGCGSPGRGRSQGCFIGYGFVQSDGDGAIHRAGKVQGEPGGSWHRWESDFVLNIKVSGQIM